MKWRLGRVRTIISGKDGVTRGAKVRLGERNKRSAVIERPLQKLNPLEVNDDDNKDDPMDEASCNRPDLSKNPSKNIGLGDLNDKGQANLSKNLNDDKFDLTKTKRPIRNAAIKGQNKRRLQNY